MNRATIFIHAPQAAEGQIFCVEVTATFVPMAWGVEVTAGDAQAIKYKHLIGPAAVTAKSSPPTQIV